jgi:Mg-chelatase subunit ChlD
MKLGFVLLLGGGLFCIAGAFVVALPAHPAPPSKASAQAQTAPRAKSALQSKFATQSGSPTSSSITLSGEVNVLAGACAASGITIKDNKLPTVIEKVRMGSAAAYAGLAEGDRVLNGQIGENKMFLAIERAGKKYTVALQYTPDNLAADAAREAARKNPSLKLSAAVTTPEQERKLEAARILAAAATESVDWRTLKNYEIVVMVDSSGSMDDMLNSPPMTKWEWCSKEIVSLAKEAERLGSGGFTLCTFESDHEIFTNCTAANVRQFLRNRHPGGGTNLATPLNEVIDRHFKNANRKPLLVVVITDALVSNDEIENILIAASKRVRSPQEAQFLFLQLGDDAAGQELAQILDDELTTLGAQYDIVSSITSDPLVSFGLRRGMIAAMTKAPETRHAKKAATPSEELARVREELRRLRASKVK